MSTMTHQGNGFTGYHTAPTGQVAPLVQDPGASPGARGADPTYLLSIARHNNGCLGTAQARVDDGGSRQLAAELAPLVFAGNSRSETPSLLVQASEQLANPEPVVQALAGRLRPPPDVPTPEAYKAWLSSLLGTRPTDDLGLELSVQQEALLREARAQLESLGATGPSLALARAKELMDVLGRAPSADPSASKFNQLLQRWMDCRQLSNEMTAEVWERAQAEFQRLATSMGAALAKDCAQSLWQSLLGTNSASVLRWLGQFGQMASGTLEACRLAASSQAYELPGGPDLAGGRCIDLPGPSRESVTKSVLEKAGVQNLVALAGLLRQRLGELPKTPAAANDAAAGLLGLVLEFAGLPSAWSHVQDPDALANELFRRSHPPASLRYLDSELNVDPCHHLFILGPATQGTLEESRLSALRVTLGRLGNCSVDFVPGGSPGVIRVARVFAGYPSVADSSDDLLRGAYLELASLNKHKPHPLGSRLTGPDFLMDLRGNHSGLEGAREDLK